MKQFLTASAMLFSLLAAAQFPNLPYNPDENSDGLIGVVDLQGLLANYGSDWNPDSLVIYGLSELIEPEFCIWPGNINTCAAQDWRIVPDDADVVYWDLGNVGTDYKLWLPIVPRQLIVLGTTINSSVVMNGYFYDQNQNWTGSGIPTFTEMENSARVTFLIPFAQKYWMLSK